MTWLRHILFKFQALFMRRQLEQDLAEELRLHLEESEERKRAGGLGENEARYVAMREFGGAEQAKEQCREAWAWRWIDLIFRDLFYAVRLLRRSPMFSVTAVASLALCLGMNTAVFSVLHDLVLRPLPFHEAENIVEVHSAGPKVGVHRLSSNVGQYLDFKANAPAFAALSLWLVGHDVLADPGGAVRLPVAIASAEIFPLLALQPIAGRFFGPENLEKGNDKVVVLTESYWRAHFDGAHSAIGQHLRLNGDTYEIIGIAPRLFEALDARAKLVRPCSFRPDQVARPSRTAFYASLFGRLAPGAALADARAQVTALEQRYFETAPPATQQFAERTGLVALVDRVQDQRSGPLKVALWLLQVAAGLVVLIGAINVANLFLARGNARQREFLTRAALGASQHDILRQSLIEAGLVGACGGLAGFALAWVTLQGANSFAAVILPSALPFELNAAVSEASLVTGLVVTCFISALFAGRVLQQTFSGISLQVTDRTASAPRSSRSLAGSLVITQIAFALVLSIGATLLVRSFLSVMAQPPGFEPSQLVTARIDLPRDMDKTLPTRIEEAFQSVPDFDGSIATATPFLPAPEVPYSMAHSGTLSIHGDQSGGSLPGVYFCGVSASYAKVIGLPILRGRWFTETDIASGRSVVVDESFSQRFFPGQNPVGRRIALGAPKAKLEEWPEIIGVVRNVAHNGVEDRSGVPFTYFSRDHTPFFADASVLIRTTRQPTEALAILRRIVRDIDPTLPVYAENTMSQLIINSVGRRQAIMLTLAVFAAVALLLSAIGVFGILAYDVSRRTREIGVRTALGASRVQIVRMIVSDGTRKAIVGVLLGLGVSLAASRLIASLLFEVTATDVTAYTCSAALLLFITLLAAWLPARRAAKINPMVALRCE